MSRQQTSKYDRDSAAKATETVVLGTLLAAKPGDLGPWATVAAELPSLAAAMHDRNYGLIAVGIARAAKQGSTEASDVANELAAIPLGEAAEAISGSDRGTKRALAHDDSALAAVGGTASLYELAGQASLTSLRKNAWLVRQRADAMALSIELAKLSDDILRVDPTRGIADHLDRLTTRLGDVRRGSGSAGTTAGDALATALAEGDQAEADRRAGAVPATWGLDALDRHVPLVPGRMIVLAAGPGVGKTSLATQAAVASAESCGPDSVLYLSLEQTAADVAAMLAGRALRLSSEALRLGQLSPTDRDRALALAEEWRAAGGIRFRDLASGRCTVHDLASFARLRRLAVARLSLVVVDYLGLLDATEKRQNEYERLSEATREIKRLAADLRVPVLLLAQLNREGHKAGRGKGGEAGPNPEPRLADLRGSGSIEQDADAVVLLHRPSDDAGAESVEVAAIVAKNRRGPIGRITCEFVRASQEFRRSAGAQPPPRPVRSGTPTDSEDAFA